MTITKARPDEEPTPEDIEPQGFVRLYCADTDDSIELQADQLARVRHWQQEGPPGWVRAIDRYGDVRDFWWPSIRQIEVVTPRGRARSREVEDALEREHERRRPLWD